MRSIVSITSSDAPGHPGGTLFWPFCFLGCEDSAGFSVWSHFLLLPRAVAGNAFGGWLSTSTRLVGGFLLVALCTHHFAYMSSIYEQQSREERDDNMMMKRASEDATRLGPFEDARLRHS